MASGKRRIPHIEGNFATIVAIRVVQRFIISDLKKLQSFYLKLLPSTSQSINLDATDNSILGTHISLSLTQYFKSYQLDSFVQRIAHVTANSSPIPIRILSSPLRRFSASVNNDVEVRPLVKRQRTASPQQEWFAGLEVDPRTLITTLGPLLDDIDHVIEEFGGIKFPKPHRPHISLFHILNTKDLSDEVISNVNVDDLFDDLCFTVQSITIRIGKCHIDIPLGTPLKNQWNLEKILAEQISGGDQRNTELDEDDF